MATLTIRRLDEAVKTRLRVRAAHHGRSMEDEAREILKASLTADAGDDSSLVETIRKHFRPLGFVHIPLPPREPARQPPKFDE